MSVLTTVNKHLKKVQARVYKDPSLSDVIEPFSHNYPWQMYTKSHDLMLSARLEQQFPADELAAECAEVFANFAPQQQFGQYHKGGWGGVALYSPDGDPLQDQDWPSAEYAKSPALKFAPTMEKIIDSFPCDKRRIRLLQLEPGKKIFWHCDYMQSVDFSLLRMHVPVQTNDKVALQISHQDCPWKPGELWYGDFTFPHRLQNGGDEARVHLVIDLEKNDELLALLPEKLQAQRAARMKARRYCYNMVKWWNRVFATEQRLRSDQASRQTAA